MLSVAYDDGLDWLHLVFFPYRVYCPKLVGSKDANLYVRGSFTSRDKFKAFANFPYSIGKKWHTAPSLAINCWDTVQPVQ